MTSEIKVDTISEKTSANGVTIDSLGIKDGKITNLMNATLSAADLGGGLHVKTADSGASVAANYDEIVIENSDHAGMSILTGTDKVGAVRFGDSGDNDIGGVLYNHDDNSMTFKVNAADKWKIDSTGNLIPGATTTGIYLGVTSATASNLLDDYEEGTWTPVLKSNANTITGGTRLATYTKVGRMVHVFFSLAGGTTSGTIDNSGDFFRIQGLPFTAANVTGTRYIGTQLNYYSNFSMSEENVLGVVGQNESQIEFLEHDGATTGYSGARLNSVGSGGYAQFAVTYYV